MKHKRISIFSLTVCLMMVFALASSAQEQRFIPLFDGETLDGWKKAEENQDTFSIEDGAIKAQGPRCHLFYVGDVENHDFKNFILRVDVMTKPNSNGGIFFHTEYQATGWPRKGYEVQVNNTYENDPRKTGSLYNTRDVFEQHAEDNEWFTEEIIVFGDHVIVNVDGEMVVNYIEPEENRENDESLPSGTIALQGHDPGSTIYYKNIRIMPLPEMPEWKPLFNGENLEGWERINGKAEFTVEDGALVGTTVEGSPNSFLCTKKHYSDFELEFEVKVDPRLNSGVQVRSNSKEDYKDGRVHGYQVEIDPSDRSWSGGIYDEARRGWLNDLKDNEEARKTFDVKKWNTFRVFCYKDRIMTWVNGVPAADLEDDMTRKGFIGLQVHSFKGDPPAQVKWRNLRIRDLSRDEEE